MKLKRTLRFSIIKLMRVWNCSGGVTVRRIFKDIKFILEPLKKTPKSVSKQNGTKQDQWQVAQSHPTKPKDEPSQHENNASKEKRYGPIEITKFLMECVALLLAIMAGAIYFWQGYESKRQAAASEGQLLAMRGQLLEMKKARELDERAWLLPEEGKFMPDDKPEFFSVVSRNTGKTPAMHVHGTMGFTTSSNRIPITDDYPTNCNEQVTAPGGTCLNTIPLNLIHLQWAVDMANGLGTNGYIWGTVWYDDVFGKHHWNQFCYTISTQDPRFIKGAPFHNDCDKDEADKPN